MLVTHLERKLTTIQDGALERVLLLLQLGSCTLSRRQEILQNGRQETLALVLLDEQVFHVEERKSGSAQALSIGPDRKGDSESGSPPFGVLT